MASIRFQRYKKAIIDSEYDQVVFQEIINSYDEEIKALEKRRDTNKNKFIKYVCQRDIDDLKAERKELMSLV